MKKKVAVFSTSWNDAYLYKYLVGVWKTAKENNIDVYVFNTYGDADLYGDFNKCEYNIFNLPELEDFDGVLVMSNNVGSAPWLEKLRQRIVSLNIPCVAVEQKLEDINYIGTDNYAAMREVVEYLVIEKGCKVLNYVGGPADNSENILRKKAFLDVLEENGLVCEERRIRDYLFRKEDGRQAYKEFKELGIEKPDAVVCANDNMALGYWIASVEDGLDMPKDYLVTGFDNTALSVMNASRITSIDRAGDTLGVRSMEQLVGMIEGTVYPECAYAPHRLIRPDKDCDEELKAGLDQRFWKSLYDREIKREENSHSIRNFRLVLLENQNKGVFFKALLSSIQSFGITNFCFCMDEKFDDYMNKCEKGYSDQLEVYGVFGGNNLERNTIDVKQMVPEEFSQDSEKSHIMLFSPSHCSGRRQGYCVIMDNLEIIKDRRLYDLMMIINPSLEAMRQNIQLRKMNEELNRLYCMDQMTNLYNRFALEEKGERLFERNIEQNKLSGIIFVDMDSLKMVNDIFGHAIGDICLRVIADAIKGALIDESWFGVRYGGDEFLALGTVEDEDSIREMIAKIHTNIQQDYRKQNFTFDLTASVGYVLIAPDEYKGLEYHIKVADDDMYKIKKAKKGIKQ